MTWKYYSKRFGSDLFQSLGFALSPQSAADVLLVRILILALSFHSIFARILPATPPPTARLMADEAVNGNLATQIPLWESDHRNETHAGFH